MAEEAHRTLPVVEFSPVDPAMREASNQATGDGKQTYSRLFSSAFGDGYVPLAGAVHGGHWCLRQRRDGTNDGCGGRCGYSISELSTSEDGHGSVVVTCALVAMREVI